MPHKNKYDYYSVIERQMYHLPQNRMYIQVSLLSRDLFKKIIHLGPRWSPEHLQSITMTKNMFHNVQRV